MNYKYEERFVNGWSFLLYLTRIEKGVWELGGLQGIRVRIERGKKIPGPYSPAKYEFTLTTFDRNGEVVDHKGRVFCDSKVIGNLPQARSRAAYCWSDALQQAVADGYEITA